VCSLCLQVSRTEYQSCTVFDPRLSDMIVNCSKPSSGLHYELVIWDYAAIPNTPDFSAGLTYYFISKCRTISCVKVLLFLSLQVSEDAFNKCSTSTSTLMMVVNCSNPASLPRAVKFTLWIWPYQAVPGVNVDFEAGQSYYFICKYWTLVCVCAWYNQNPGRALTCVLNLFK
jgi:hypothetical protein